MFNRTAGPVNSVSTPSMGSTSFFIWSPHHATQHRSPSDDPIRKSAEASLSDRALSQRRGRRRANRRIDAHTTRHSGYRISTVKRKRIEEPFGWIKELRCVFEGSGVSQREIEAFDL
jgi:hypothetical protein